MTDVYSTEPLDLSEPSWEVPEAELTVLSGKHHRYALVIPVINEGERIRRQLRAIADLAPDLDVIVADGGSTDGSLALDYLVACGVRALLVKHGPGRLSAQLRMAYAWALDQGYEGVVTVDGNGKDGLEVLPRFIEALEAGVDYVQGSRYCEGGEAVNTPLDRKIAGRLIHAPVLSLAAGYWFTDTTNGFRGYSRRYLIDPQVAPFRDIFDRYNLLFYLTLRANQLGYNSQELPVRRSYPVGEKTPTKISGLSGRFAMMGELLRCALGGCIPRDARPLDQQPSRPADRMGEVSGTLVTLMLLAVGLCIAATRIVPLIYPHDPWLDEAMLLANLPLNDGLAFFQPLPLFEQAAPLGYLFSANVLTAWFPDAAALALRVLSAAASLLAAGLLLLSLRRLVSGPSVALALTLVCLPSFAVIYSVEIKQYIFEYLSACLLLYLSIRLALSYSRTNLLLFLAGGLFSILFSFTAPIVIGAIGTGVLAQRWASYAKDRAARWQIGTILTLATLAAVFIAYYYAYTHPTTEIQLAAFAEIYQPGLLVFPPLTLDDLSLWLKFPGFLLHQIDGGLATYRDLLPAHMPSIIGGLLVFFFAIGLVVSTCRFLLLPVAFLVASLLVYGLSVAGLLPITVERHFAFMLPFTGIILGLGLFRSLLWVGSWVGRRHAQMIAFLASAAVLFAFAMQGLIRSADLARQEISPLLDYIEEHNDDDAAAWIYYGAQPAMRVIASDRFEQIGGISHASSETGWVWENRVYPETVHKEKYLEAFRNTIRGRPSLWLLFSHYVPFEHDGLFLFFAIAQEEIGNCRQVMKAEGTLLWRCN
ncbi:MAG: hypothetical protein Kilf2KO_05070 [Rhodospirillales bacterium]